MLWLYILVVFLFALVYSKMETLIESGGRKWQPVIGKYGMYHLWLLVLDLVVNLPALASGALGYLFCVTLFPLLEDIFYFVWLRKLIKPTNWTAKEGAIKIGRLVIPYWYFGITGFLILLLTLALE